MEIFHKIVSEHVRDVKDNEKVFLVPSDQESQVRLDFIDTFIAALSWDVTHTQQKNPYQQEVKIENKVVMDTSQRRECVKYFVSLLFFFSLLCLPFSGCKDNPTTDDGPYIDTGIVPNPPYDSPIWHPSGQFIGFNHTPLIRIEYPNGIKRAGHQVFDYDLTGFWLINPDGSNLRRIFPSPLLLPSWSPDGNWIAFRYGYQIYKMRFTGIIFDTSSIMQLTFSGENTSPRWSPDGQLLTYERILPDSTGPSGVWLMKTDGSAKHYLFGGSLPAWDPTGQYILAEIGTSPTSVYTKFIKYSLHEARVIDTLAAVKGNVNGFPLYSPDGIRICFWSNFNLWIMDSAGNNLRQLPTNGVDFSFGVTFSWNPNGSNIVYTAYQSNNWGYNNGTLWMLNPDNGEKWQLTFNQISK